MDRIEIRKVVSDLRADIARIDERASDPHTLPHVIDRDALNRAAKVEILDRIHSANLA